MSDTILVREAIRFLYNFSSFPEEENMNVKQKPTKARTVIYLHLMKRKRFMVSKMNRHAGRDFEHYQSDDKKTEVFPHLLLWLLFTQKWF